ncbi:MAG: GNAT family N-acetyltransferase [Patescibacteria group bacterium]
MHKIATEKKNNCFGFKFSVNKNGAEIARGFLYVLYNNLHQEPFGLIEDVFVEENARGMGYGLKILKKIIKESKKLGCYKLIATSRYSRKKVHNFYKKLGFKDYGKEFRMDF